MMRLLKIVAAGLIFIFLFAGIIAYRQFLYLPLEQANAASSAPSQSSMIVSSGQAPARRPAILSAP